MNRRDTILVAVLINTGLLAILFATAINKEPATAFDETLSFSSNVTPPAHEQIICTASSTQSTKDEGDQALARYRKQQTPAATSNTAQKSEVKAESTISTNRETAESPTQTAASPAKPAKAEEGYVEITVKRGDVLERIARANSTTVSAIMSANQLTGTQLSVGQVLKIPVDQAHQSPHTSSSKSTQTQVASTQQQEPPPAPTKSSSSQGEPEYYIVQSGDNPWAIARKHGIRLDELKALNALDETKARNLKPGDRLRLR